MDDEKKEHMVIRSVTITKEHKKFLEDNSDINFSGLIRNHLDKYIILKMLTERHNENEKLNQLSKDEVNKNL